MAKAGLLYVGTDAGVLVFSEPGGIGRWLRVGHGLEQHAVQSLWADHDSPVEVVASTPAGLFRSSDGGQQWQPIQPELQGTLVGSKAAAGVVWCVSSAGALWQSRDHGQIWHELADQPGPFNCLLSSPQSGTTLVAASNTQLWQSRDGGVQWTPHSPASPGSIMAMTGDAVHGPLVVATTTGLFRLIDQDWQPASTAASSIAPLAWLPGKQPVLLATAMTGTVVRSSDQGNTWEATAEHPWQPPVTVLHAASYHMDTACAGDQDGVALTSDRGRTWVRLKQGLGPVRALTIGRII